MSLAVLTKLISARYDPPVALTPRPAVATPTLPGDFKHYSTEASPASSYLPNEPTATRQEGLGSNSPTSSRASSAAGNEASATNGVSIGYDDIQGTVPATASSSATGQTIKASLDALSILRSAISAPDSSQHPSISTPSSISAENSRSFNLRISEGSYGSPTSGDERPSAEGGFSRVPEAPAIAPTKSAHTFSETRFAGPSIEPGTLPLSSSEGSDLGATLGRSETDAMQGATQTASGTRVDTATSETVANPISTRKGAVISDTRDQRWQDSGKASPPAGPAVSHAGNDVPPVHGPALASVAATTEGEVGSPPTTSLRDIRQPTTRALTGDADAATASPAPSETDGVAFTAASMTFASQDDGKYAHGTVVLSPGEPLTLSAEASRVTLSLTKLGGLPALVIDGTTTSTLRPAMKGGSPGQLSPTAIESRSANVEASSLAPETTSIPPISTASSSAARPQRRFIFACIAFALSALLLS